MPNFSGIINPYLTAPKGGFFLWKYGWRVHGKRGGAWCVCDISYLRDYPYTNLYDNVWAMLISSISLTIFSVFLVMNVCEI